MNKAILFVFAAAICLCAVSTIKAELLVNGGFELGGTPPPATWQEGWVPSNWFKWGVGGWSSWKSASRQSLGYTPYEGDKFFAAGAWTSGEHQNIGQVVKVYPGEVFTFSVMARTEIWGTPSAPNGYFMIEWYDISGTVIGTPEYGTLISGSEVPSWTQYSYVTSAAPANANTCNFQIEGDAQGTIMIDNASVKLRYAANDPVPDNNTSVSPTTTQLHWTRPAPASSGTVTVDVWFGTSIASMTKKIDNQAVDSWTISPALSAPAYYWRVDCRDNGNVTQGRQWVFYTNTAPVVNPGPKQNLWLASGTASADMNAVVTDDALPNPPAAVTYLWSVDSGPGSVTFTPNAAVLNPKATFTTAGDYSLKLTANDSQFSGAGTVKIRVFAPSDTGLVAEYKLNETSDATALDNISGHDGTLMGTSLPTWQPAGGKIGGALQFVNSQAQYVNCGGGYTAGGDHNLAPTWADFRDELTVSAWIKLPLAGWPGGNNPWTAIVAKGDTSWRLTRNANTDTVYFFCNGLQAYGQEVIGVTNVADNQWHFITGTYDGARIALYIDGLLQHSYPSSGQISMDVAHVTIGNNLDQPDRLFAGLIDEVRIHNVGLSQDKIIEQYVADGGTTRCPGYLEGDLNNDCYIDFEDFARIAENWLKCNDITNGRCE
ncbi:MAG: LamG-like jellyroll fold domain-containing protein [Phycisphaerales bacterium]